MKLTKEQQQAVQAKREELESQGASPREIHEAITGLLKEWGIEVPAHCGFRGHGPHLFTKLSEEQQQAIQAKKEELESQGASPREIHEAIAGLLKEWGIEVPAHCGFRGHGPHLFTNLSKEQHVLVCEKVKKMKENGASREEICGAVNELIVSFGIGEVSREQNSIKDIERFNGIDTPELSTNASPNPFNPETVIHYTLKSASLIKIRIYNVKGQLIRTLVNEKKDAGTYQVIWNGTNDHEIKVVSGVYLYRIDAGHNSITKRVTFLK